jgi:large subunit ribosomal protein L4
VLVVIESFETRPALSFRNLPEVQLIKVGELNAYDVLCNDWIVFEQEHLPIADGPITTEPDAYGKAEPLPDIEPEDGAPYGAGSHAPLEDGSEPAGYPIKGNADSMLYHVPARRTTSARSPRCGSPRPTPPRPPASRSHRARPTRRRDS